MLWSYSKLIWSQKCFEKIWIYFEGFEMVHLERSFNVTLGPVPSHTTRIANVQNHKVFHHFLTSLYGVHGQHSAAHRWLLSLPSRRASSGRVRQRSSGGDVEGLIILQSIYTATASILLISNAKAVCMFSSHELSYDYWNHLFNCQERVEIKGYVGGNIRHQYQDAYTVIGRGGGGFGFAKLKVVLVSVQFFQAQLRSKLVVKRCLVFHIHINRRRPIVHMRKLDPELMNLRRPAPPTRLVQQ